MLYRPYICPFNEILNIIPTQSSIFDIGCGSGTFLSLCAGFVSPKKLGGIEISETLVNNAKILLAEFDVLSSTRVYDGIVFPEEMKEYEIITLIDVLHHVPKEQQNNFLEQVFLKSKSGATFILKDIDASSALVYANKIHDLILSKEVGHEWKSITAEEKLRSIGFKIVSVKKQRMFWYPHYTIVCTK